MAGAANSAMEASLAINHISPSFEDEQDYDKENKNNTCAPKPIPLGIDSITAGMQSPPRKKAAGMRKNKQKQVKLGFIPHNQRPIMSPLKQLENNLPERGQAASRKGREKVPQLKWQMPIMEAPGSAQKAAAEAASPSTKSWFGKVQKLVYSEEDANTPKTTSSQCGGWFASVSRILQTNDTFGGAPAAAPGPSHRPGKAAGKGSPRGWYRYLPFETKKLMLEGRSMAAEEILRKAQEVVEREKEIMHSFALLNEERRSFRKEKEALKSRCIELESALEHKAHQLRRYQDDLKDRNDFVQFLRDKHSMEERVQNDKIHQNLHSLEGQLKSQKLGLEAAEAERDAMKSQRDRARADRTALQEMLNLEAESCSSLQQEIKRLKNIIKNGRRRPKIRRTPSKTGASIR